MSGRLISTIYFYLISAIATILLVIGVYNAISLTINTTQYDKYPLRFGGADRCSYISTQFPASEPQIISKESVTTPAPSMQDQEQQRKQCEESLDAERKQNKIDDIKNSIAFSLIGIILFIIHFPIALRRSNEGK